MSSICSALASLDDSLAVLRESLGKLEAAKPVDIAEVIEQFKMATESTRNLSALVLSELPDASWQNREELNALLEEIQSAKTRESEHRRSRLLALAAELERGRIMHRRPARVSQLNQLRDQAIKELRSHAAVERAPQTLPGPEADQWIEWACGLKEPEDAETIQSLRNGFAHLDDFVANLEPNMWIAPRSLTAAIESGVHRVIETPEAVSCLAPTKDAPPTAEVQLDPKLKQFSDSHEFISVLKPILSNWKSWPGPDN